MKKFVLALTLIVVSGLIQNTGFFLAFGIKPNLLLAVLVAASFFMESFAAYLGLLAGALFFLRFESGFRPELLAFAVLAVSVFLVNRLLPWRQSVNNLVLAALFVILFYALADISYLWTNLAAVVGEIIYTSIFSILFYDLFRQLSDNEDNIFKR